ncbi:MAG: hypothetical protein ABI574_02660 [Burkholderiales bacterium]
MNDLHRATSANPSLDGWQHWYFGRDENAGDSTVYGDFFDQTELVPNHPLGSERRPAALAVHGSD